MYIIFISVILLLLIIIYLLKTQPQQDIVVVNNIPSPPPPMRTRDPEFRGPPLKRYKPRNFQQMGILTNDDGKTLPLYGRESRTHRDRYHYYSTTPGDQIYPLPINFNNNNCTEDIGCPEFYGNESVNVTGQTGAFSTNIYKTENFLEYY
jgi:hypothetical protein